MIGHSACSIAAAIENIQRDFDKYALTSPKFIQFLTDMRNCHMHNPGVIIIQYIPLVNCELKFACALKFVENSPKIGDRFATLYSEIEGKMRVIYSLTGKFDNYVQSNKSFDFNTADIIMLGIGETDCVLICN